jgi:hypothetical protein
MNFVNPFELLDVIEADAASIKKAKRRKLAEFELSDDGLIEFGNQKVTKSDFIRVTDELDNNDKVEFYLFIKNNQRLNAFLTNGDTSFFVNYRQESIYSETDFINFISPYFAQQYNKALLEAFQNDNVPLLKGIIANPPMVNGRDTEKAYKGLLQFLKTIEDELHKIRTEIDSEESYYDEDTIDELNGDLREKANIGAINLLPSYFQVQRNEIAQKVRNISVAVFNGTNNADVAFEIISYSLEFNTNNLTNQKLRKDYEQIKEIYEKRKEIEHFSTELARYAGTLLQIVELKRQVESNQISTSSIQPKVNSLFSVFDLNQLPSVFDEIRDQIAIAIRGLSVAVWNERSDLEVALGLIQTAQKINMKAEVKLQINKAFNELNQLRNKQAEPIIEILQDISKAIRQVDLSYDQTVNKDKVIEVLNGVFQSGVIQALKNINPELKGRLFDELRPILAILPSNFVNGFIDKLSGIASGDSGLTSKLDRMRQPVNKPTAPANQDESENSWLLWVAGILFIFYCISQCN